MNKNIEFIGLESSSLKQIIDCLNQDNQNIMFKEELLPALNSLLKGQVSSLILELSNNANVANDPIIQVKDLAIYPKSRKVIRNGVEISLTPKEFDILYFLARNKGTVFPKEQIYCSVWEDDYLLDDSNIMAFIRKLRKKIEPNPDNPIYILTIWGIGYKFNDVFD